MKMRNFTRNEHLEGVFNRAASGFDSIGPQYFSYFGAGLVHHARLAKGDSVLDIACGKGASLIPAALKVGLDGSVLGIDFSENMITQTRQHVETLNMKQVSLRQMDAEAIAYEDQSFDAVLCGLSIAFFSDSRLALSEMTRVLKTGGTLGISSWKRKAQKSVLASVHESLFGDENRKENVKVTASDRPDFSTEEGATNAFVALGLSDVKCIVDKRVFHYADEEEWWAEQWSNASRGLFEHAEKVGKLGQLKAMAFDALADMKDEKGIRFEAEVIYTFGKK